MQYTVLAIALLLAGTLLIPARGAEPPEDETPTDRSIDRALAFLNTMQDRGDGSWRALGQKNVAVTALAGSDLSVTGWQVMALRAAKNLGCDVPAEAIDQAVDYIKRSQDFRTGGFCYTPQGNLTVPCTGTGILALELCGKDRHRSQEALRAGAFLIRRENLPHFGRGYFFYSIYYGSQATFQLGDNYWGTYRPHLQQVLLRNQRDNGSWNTGGSDGSYGPNYSTAMAVLALTVEYRFLPIYQRGEEPTDVER
jgi:hypothetical protein